MQADYRKAKIVAQLAALFFFVAQPAVWMGTACAAPASEQAKSPKLFATEATLPLTLTAPWRDFARNKSSKTSYPATLEYVDESGARRSLPVAVASRGHNRQKVCKFPPIKLIFEKDAVKESPFRGNKSLKLVTRCDSDERSEQYIAKELLAYRIYNLITERSFKARPLSVTYVDSADRSSDGAHVAFLLEDDSDLAKRNHLARLDVATLDLSRLESTEASRLSLFEYLIGNTDFAVLNGAPGKHCCHNSVLIGEDVPSKVYAVPYDFDSSGLVDAHYAVPNAVLHISSNRERVYRGFCANNATLDAARREFLRLEPQILELGRNDSRLVDGSKVWVSDYLAKGFEVLRDDAKFARDVTAKCRK